MLAPGDRTSPTRTSFGIASLSISSLFVPSSAVRLETPVTLPPGRARLATRPAPTGSPTFAITMGIVVVALFAANAGAVPVATIRSTLRRTRSAARSGREFQIGKAQFRGQNYCDPCLRPSRLSGKTQKFLESFSDRGGLIAEILQGGTIKKGDLITLHALPHEAYYYRNREPQNK